MEQNNQNNYRQMGNEMERALHSSKSYVGAAILTWALYYIGFFIIGLIVNIVYLSSSKKTMLITGSSPSGRGCLWLLLWFHLIIPLILIVLLLTGGLAILPFIN